MPLICQKALSGRKRRHSQQREKLLAWGWGLSKHSLWFCICGLCSPVCGTASSCLSLPFTLARTTSSAVAWEAALGQRCCSASSDCGMSQEVSRGRILSWKDKALLQNYEIVEREMVNREHSLLCCFFHAGRAAFPPEPHLPQLLSLPGAVLQLCPGAGTCGNLSSPARGISWEALQTLKLPIFLCAKKKPFRLCEQDSWFHSWKNSFPKPWSPCPPAMSLFCFKKWKIFNSSSTLLDIAFW